MDGEGESSVLFEPTERKFINQYTIVYGKICQASATAATPAITDLTVVTCISIF